MPLAAVLESEGTCFMDPADGGRTSMKDCIDVTVLGWSQGNCLLKINFKKSGTCLKFAPMKLFLKNSGWQCYSAEVGGLQQGPLSYSGYKSLLRKSQLLWAGQLCAAGSA